MHRGASPSFHPFANPNSHKISDGTRTAVRQAADLPGPSFCFPRGYLLYSVSHRPGRPRKPSVADHPGPQTHCVHHPCPRLPPALPRLAVERPLHRHRPSQRVVPRLTPPHARVPQTPDHDRRDVYVERLENRLVGSTLDPARLVRDLPLHLRVIDRLPSSCAAERRPHLRQGRCHGLPDPPEFLRHLDHQLDHMTASRQGLFPQALLPNRKAYVQNGSQTRVRARGRSIDGKRRPRGGGAKRRGAKRTSCDSARCGKKPRSFENAEPPSAPLSSRSASAGDARSLAGAIQRAGSSQVGMQR